MNNILFLDLEETVIEEWGNPFLINIPWLRKFIRKEEFTDFGIFSFAISNERDSRHFHTRLKDGIQDSLGIEFNKDLVTTTQDMKSIIAKRRRILPSKFSDQDFSDFFLKDTAFLEFASTFENTKLTLVDDTITDGEFVDTFRSNRVVFVDINTLNNGSTFNERNPFPQM